VARPGRWRLVAPPVVAFALLVGGVPAVALGAYQASIDTNTTAFNPPCDDDGNATVPKMQAAAKAAFGRMNYVATAYTGTAFTRSATLTRTPNDWGYYVHSHGDFYLNADGRRYTGFREDSGDCDQAVVFSKDLKARRAGRSSNLVFLSACHGADANTTMPDAFAIEKVKATGGASQGAEFFVSYRGLQWDGDEWIFEQRFWNALAGGRSVGQAFDIAMLGVLGSGTFDADWWGSYWWSGWGGPMQTCRTCS
jgi:hypothetical protein